MEDVEGTGQCAPDQIGRQVRGYQGYATQDQRRATDKLLRAHLSCQLEGLATKLDGAAGHARRLGAETVSEPLARLHRKLCTIREGLQTPAYLESAFFERDRLPEETLQSLYDCELALLKEVSTLNEELADLDVSCLSETEVQERAMRMGDAVDAFNQALFERESLLLSWMGE
ncbi:MAG: hypothetical protein ONB07_02000 [candidate division KSB1 bacterium]|nr:hypothetical protein [candidate division KSB1 bacterium]MDZ7391421.1 hypothetical protein [candidate division KSB1 bacterium]